MSRLTIRYEPPPLDASIATVVYVLMFHSAWHIRRQPLYYFEIEKRSQKNSGWTLFMMHQHFYKAYLRFRHEVAQDLTVVSISSTEDEPDDTL